MEVHTARKCAATRKWGCPDERQLTATTDRDAVGTKRDFIQYIRDFAQDRVLVADAEPAFFIQDK